MSTLPALIIDSLLKTFLQPDRMPTLSRYGWALFTSLDERGGIWGEGGGYLQWAAIRGEWWNEEGEGCTLPGGFGGVSCLSGTPPTEGGDIQGKVGYRQ